MVSMRAKQLLPAFVAISAGLATLFGLLFLPGQGQTLLRWGAFLAAFALLLGVANLAAIHARRFFTSFNAYSGLLLLGLLTMIFLGLSDGVGLTTGGANTLFNLVQAPLEAALAALLAFFLLFAGMRLLRFQRSVWGGLFLGAALVTLIGTVPLPAGLSAWLAPVRDLFAALFVQAGMRGLLIGVALGISLISIRLLLGLEQPYNK